MDKYTKRDAIKDIADEFSYNTSDVSKVVHSFLRKVFKIINSEEEFRIPKVGTLQVKLLDRKKYKNVKRTFETNVYVACYLHNYTLKFTRNHLMTKALKKRIRRFTPEEVEEYLKKNKS